MSDDDPEYGVTDACPHCDAGPEALYRRAPGFSKPTRGEDADKDWYCRRFEHAFDTQRGPNANTPAASTMGASPIGSSNPHSAPSPARTPDDSLHSMDDHRRHHAHRPRHHGRTAMTPTAVVDDDTTLNAGIIVDHAKIGPLQVTHSTRGYPTRVESAVLDPPGR
ncbi:hypothetical protein [Halorubellus litoreus]|uniref:Uncharacterized protein n=1 Tax=Halorubellus litoreus TaxID=755308 RepID=A0ABD5VL53_9EURY